MKEHKPGSGCNTITLSEAVHKSEVQGRFDIYSGLGSIYLPSVDAWYPAAFNMILTLGKPYKFRDRFGVVTDFIA